MQRVLIVTYYWPPSGGAGVQRWLKFSKFLPEFGWEPIILTVDPESASYPVLDESLLKEIPTSTRILRTRSKEWFSVYKKVSGGDKIPYAGFANEKKTTSFKQKFARFIRGNFFIPDPRKGWNRYAVKAAKELLKEENISCIITTGPPQSTHLIGLKLNKKTGIPWLADFRDPWTDIYYYRKFYPTLLAHNLNLNLEKKVLKGANKVITVRDGFKNLFLIKNCISSEKIEIIPNGFDEDDFHANQKLSKDKFRITYVGTLAESYPLDSFIEAVGDLMKNGNEIFLRFIGSISDIQQKKLNSLTSENIEYIDYLEHKEALAFMQQTSVLLLVIPEHNSSKGILPGKIFEYMAAERPIMGIGPIDSDSAKMLSKTGTGKMLAFTDKEGMQETIKTFYSNYINNIEFIPDNNYLQYSRKNLSGKLSNILNDLSR